MRKFRGGRVEKRPSLAGLVLLRTVLGWLLLLVALALFPGAQKWVTQATVQSFGIVLLVFDPAVAVHGDLISLGTARLQVVGECTSLAATGLLGVAMLAYPSSARSKAIGITLGACILWAYNLARLSAVLWILRWKPEALEFVHVYLWQAFTLVVLCGLFVVWLRTQRA